MASLLCIHSRSWNIHKLSPKRLNECYSDINATQYTSHHKDKVTSVLPVHAHFITSRYRKKIPIPTDNTSVVVEGFLHLIETDDSNRAVHFHLTVENVHFFGMSFVPAPFSIPSRPCFYLFRVPSISPFLRHRLLQPRPLLQTLENRHVRTATGKRKRTTA